jgi:glycosyltransferase involved in cell wall biosynthesis
MKDNYFLYVGNAYPHKNVEVLLHAAAKAGVRVVFVGKEDFFYKRLGIHPKTVTDAELFELYKNATALVFPSLMEGFGLPALEALSNNCPVIVSDIPVFHELLGNAAIYFNPRSVDDLVKCLKSAMVKRPPVDSSIVKKYSWQKMAKETVSVYEDCTRVRSGQ